ncbi:MAG: Hsp33 family molecular chaperone HslO [Burkholderiaceae bacterium]|jgi:molecular chaperone Hsp33|nr:MAG: Hsp33 family molecular chaperone HslO [Burkholderiaceae bacterium]
MSELHKFIFEGLPVRGSLVRLTDAWQEILRRRTANTQTGSYPPAVSQLLGEMSAAAVLLQGSIQFDGALVLQIMGDGPVKVAVTEVQADLGLRSTATLVGEVPAHAALADLVNAQGRGRCVITLDPRAGLTGRQPYQGIVPLADETGTPLAKLAEMVQYYMRQSEQIETVLVLAANQNAAAGLMLQRLPDDARGQPAAVARKPGTGTAPAVDEDGFNRLSVLARSLKPDELLTLGVDAILRRLFWNEHLLRFTPTADAPAPHFHCACSRERVAAMLRQLGRAEADSVLEEQGQIEVNCEFCGRQERFDAVDVAHLFAGDAAGRQPATGPVQ